MQDLRDFARLDEADFKEVDLNASLESTAEMIRHELSIERLAAAAIERAARARHQTL